MGVNLPLTLIENYFAMEKPALDLAPFVTKTQQLLQCMRLPATLRCPLVSTW